ncbi:MAG: hypothetical protein K2N56_02880 [Oscillospiraceae bacterium]|nr:hypothetical protein [Oscillospiraceae bacterium]
MTALEKQQAICDRLKETDYAAFGGDKETALKEVFNGFSSIIRYVVGTALAKEKMIVEKAAGVDAAENADREEQAAYRELTDSINMLNDLSKKLGLEPFADIDASDPDSVRRFAGEYTMEHTFGEFKEH